jgi:hypothetical protein
LNVFAKRSFGKGVPKQSLGTRGVRKIRNSKQIRNPKLKTMPNLKVLHVGVSPPACLDHSASFLSLRDSGHARVEYGLRGAPDAAGRVLLLLSSCIRNFRFGFVLNFGFGICFGFRISDFSLNLLSSCIRNFRFGFVLNFGFGICFGFRISKFLIFFNRVGRCLWPG